MNDDRQHGPDSLNDPERLQALRRTEMLDSPPETTFDRLTRLATRVLGVPVALVSLVDEDRQFFKSCVGLPEPWASRRETPLSHSFCQHVVRQREPLVVSDAREHPLLRENLAIRDLGVVAYLGVPLVTREGAALGSLCAIEDHPREWSAEDVQTVEEIAVAVMAEIELREQARASELDRLEKTALLESSVDGIFGVDAEGRCTFLNPMGARMLGYAPEECVGRGLHDMVHHHRSDGSGYPKAECPITRTLRGNGLARVEDEVFWRKDGSSFPVEYSASPVYRDGIVTGAVVHFADITERRRAEQALRESEARERFLSEASALLASSLDYEETLRSVARAAVPAIADWCAVYLTEEGAGTITPVAIAHEQPEREQFAWELFQSYPQDPDAPVGAAKAIRTGETDLLHDVSDALLEKIARDEEHLRLLRTLGLSSLMAVPLLSHGITIGALAFYSSTPARRFDERDLPLAGEVARRAALAIHNARLYASERRARSDADFVAEMSRLLVGSLDPQSTFEQLARAVVPRLADLCLIDVREDGRIRRVAAVHEDPAKDALMVQLKESFAPDPEGPHPAMRALREAQTVFSSAMSKEEISGTVRGDEHLEIVRELDFQSYLCIPLAVRGNTFGVVSLVTTGESDRRLGRLDLPLAEEFARRAALAIDHARLAAERERALAEAAELAAERNAILAQVAEGVIVTDAEGRITFVNEAAQRLHGVPQLEVTPEEYSERYHLFTMEGEPYPAEQLPLARAVRGGETVRSATWKIRRPDGSEIVAQGSAKPVESGAGEQIGAVLTLRDVTREHRMERERERLLREVAVERARLRQVFTESPAVMALYSGPDHVITLVNPSWERTVGKKDVIGRPFREVFPELSGTGLIELLDRVYETGEPYVVPEIAVPLERWESGTLEETYWSFVWRPLEGLESREQEIFVHAVEITDQVRARQEVERKAEEMARLAAALEASNRELDQFAYVASHDLKAPLRGIANLSQWIEEDLGREVPEEVKEHMLLLRGRVHRMEGLIDGILQYSRAGRIREEPEEVEVSSLLYDVLDLLSPPEGITLDIEPEMPILRTERLPLQQIFLNLVGNAVKHLPEEGGRIRIGCTPRGAVYEFAVEDNGPGIAPEYHERIFGIFQTLEARDKVEGTGIGLSLVKKLVESRGGEVWVDSEPGAGAAFHFTWPHAH